MGPAYFEEERSQWPSFQLSGWVGGNRLVKLKILIARSLRDYTFSRQLPFGSVAYSKLVIRSVLCTIGSWMGYKLGERIFR